MRPSPPRTAPQILTAPPRANEPAAGLLFSRKTTAIRHLAVRQGGGNMFKNISEIFGADLAGDPALPCREPSNGKEPQPTVRANLASAPSRRETGGAVAPHGTCHTILPPTIVARTWPLSRQPSNGVLCDLLAIWFRSRTHSALGSNTVTSPGVPRLREPCGIGRGRFAESGITVPIHGL